MQNSQDGFVVLECPRCGAPLQMQSEQITCGHCGAKLLLKRSAARHGNRPGAQQGSNIVVNGVTLNPFAYHDPQSGGMEAFSLLVPDGWQVNGGGTWIMQRPSAPVQIGLQITNPAGLEVFELFPNMYYTWSTDPMVQMTMPAGSYNLGYQVWQPMPAQAVMQQVVLPYCRRHPDLAVVDQGPAPELQQFVVQSNISQGQTTPATHDSARVRIHYTLNNQPVAEEMALVTEYVRFPMFGAFGSSENILWVVRNLNGFRAGRANLESYADLYRAILTSCKLHPAWIAYVQQIIQGLTNNTIRNQNQMAARSRQISQTLSETTDIITKGWEQRSAARDAAVENVSRALRGGELYYDPNSGRNVELPTGYSQAWSTALGEYIISDDPNFDPNVGSNQTWTPLTNPQQ